MSDDTVVTFRGKTPPTPEPEERLLLVCSNCNCRSWNLMGDGTIECANCSSILSMDRDDPAEMGWRRILENAPTDPESIKSLPDDRGTVNDVQTGDVNLARARTFRKIEEMYKKNEAAMMLAYREDGSSHAWFNVETKEQQEWVVRKLKEYVRHCEAWEISDDSE
jgi:DNA-directed RNA polymerase subunit RPC12/RpoP